MTKHIKLKLGFSVPFHLCQELGVIGIILVPPFWW